MNNIERMNNTAEQLHKIGYTVDCLNEKASQLLDFCGFILDGNQIEEEDIGFIVQTAGFLQCHSEVLSKAVKALVS